MVADRFDVAIRAGTLSDSALVSRLLGTSAYRVVASPAYLEAHGTPARPAELSGHACLRFGKQGMAVRTSWPFGRGRRAFEVAVNGRLVSDDFVVLRTAAEHGLGIACLPAAIPYEALAEGRLVSLFDSLAPPPTPLHLLYVGGKHLPPRVRAFIDFVQPRMTAALRELQAG